MLRHGGGVEGWWSYEKQCTAAPASQSRESERDMVRVH
jgi:hypothetical protein